MIENNFGEKWEIGETLKAIRLSSGMKQTEVYNNVMSRAHLQRIEKNAQIPTYPLLLNVINKFSMDINEFEYIRNEYSRSETQQLFRKFRNIKTTLNTDAMRNLIKELDDYLLKNKSAFIQNLHSILNGYLILQETNNIDKARKYFDPVWKNIQKKETWYYNDIILMSNIFYMFEDESLEFILNELDKYFVLYAEFEDIDRISRITKFNYCTLLRLQNRYFETESILDELLISAKKAREGTLILEIKFALNQIYWLKGFKEESNAENEDIIFSMELLGEIKIAEDMKKDWKKFKENQSISLH
ncbi:helix-turn-helix domain-containing protein [Listeria booriae]|uniref:helix-turn-helix domain-containing protein n=1 Tax=Listeria booriae TaxID=1552123 RepID=UPI00162560D9|nr:hypothetical protein [Listeria booriae]MBC2327227.1 hypothetical protein [Listeria booriae]